MSRLLQDLVTRQAERIPEATAIVFGQERITYGELEEISSRLAWMLKELGCKRGDRVCSLIPKSPTAIVGLLGILKADCIHVPVDISSPAPRVAKILESCENRLVLAAGPVSTLLDELLAAKRFRNCISVGWLDAEPVGTKHFIPKFCRADLDAISCLPLEYRNQATDPANILFTSGSTGVPKGVLITHVNVIHFVDWATRYFRMSAADRNSGHPPLHFDLSQFDVFGTLAVGAELHLVPPELNLLPHKLAEMIRNEQLTQWFSVPSVLNYMAKFDVLRYNDFPCMKRLLWCGETLPTPTLIHWMRRLPHVTFTNLYGPTETTIASSYYTVPECPTDEAQPIPIGTPCAGEELLVLDERLQPVSPGEIGDLYIRGVGLSPGYWRDSEKTSSVFLPHPRSTTAGDRIYKTGDLAKVGADALVYFIGRVDSQIKSRGYRIELGEIETALNSLGCLGECAVVAIESNGFEGKAICCAYVPAPRNTATPAILRKELSRLVPSYMLPSRWMVYEHLPQNASGKIDRFKLRERFQSHDTRDA